ncbi:MAG: hypothetical protein PHQ00_03535, partial [Phycisphaerae bacterium]|nr:hypothetical protein [Phycisphaerae bacterium]
HSEEMQKKITEGLKNTEANHSAAPQTTDETSEIEKAKKQFENLTDEQKAEMRKKFEQMSPEEREKAMQQMRSGNRPAGARRSNRSEESQ